MSIQYAILGLLSREGLSGYDLKKLFEDSTVLYWSGNNNQIYRSLVKLHEDSLVTKEVVDQEGGPSRKVYSITPQGLDALHQWTLSAPELPELRNTFLVQLLWCDQASDAEVEALIDAYEDEVRVKLLMLEEQERRSAAKEQTPRATLIERMVNQNMRGFYEHELDWVRELRRELQA